MSDDENSFNGMNSLKDLYETKIVPLNYSSIEGCYNLVNTGQLDNIHSIKLFPNNGYAKINYLSKKTNRTEETIIDNENQNIIKSNNEFYNEILYNQKLFYNNEKIKNLFIYDNYKKLLNKITSKNLFNKIESPYGSLIEEIELFYKDYNFLENINKIQISPNLKNENIYIQPNSIFQKVFKSIEEKKINNNNIIFIGESGMGKSYSIYLTIFLLRINPFNFIISILDYEKFILNPGEYLLNEIIFYISNLYFNQPNTKQIENILQKLISLNEEEKTYEKILSIFSNIFNQLFNDMNLDINIYFIIDSYENIIDKKEINSLTKTIEKLKQNANGILNKNFDSHYKIIKIISSETIVSNNLIIETIEEMKENNKFNNQIFMYGIIFLKTSILNNNEISYYIKRKYKKSFILNIDNNYSTIDFCINSNFDTNNIKTFEIIVDNYEIEFFNKKCKILMKEDQKEYFNLILNIFAYKTIKQFQGIPSYSYFNSKFKRYYYFFLIPTYDNNNIKFEFKNKIVESFIHNFKFENYYKFVDLSLFDLDYFTKIYNSTDFPVLKGILLEEILYLMFKKNGEDKTINLNINYFAKDENDINYKKELKLNIPKVEKSQTKENDIFERENLFSSDVDLNRDGFYFFSHKFPIIDAVIINYPNLYFIQIKKTLKYDNIYQINKDFHLFYLMMENYLVYKELLKNNDVIYRNNNQINTKLNFWLKIVNYMKKNSKLKIHYMFLYKDEEFSRRFDRDYNEITILDEFNQNKEKIEVKKINSWSINDNIKEKYKYSFEEKKLYIYCNRVKKNIILCKMEEFIREISNEELKYYFSELYD